MCEATKDNELFTPEQPTEPGFYWFKINCEKKEEVVMVDFIPKRDDLFAFACGLAGAGNVRRLAKEGALFGPRVLLNKEGKTK